MNLRTPQRAIIATGIVMLLSSSTLQAQSAQNSVKTALTAPVLKLHGECTLRDLLSSMNTATNLVVKAPNYLLDRTVIFHANGMSAESVLNALSELYGLAWRLTEDAEILITRKEIASSAGLSTRLLEAIPADCREYIGSIGKVPIAPPTTAAPVQQDTLFRLTQEIDTANARHKADACKTTADKLRRSVTGRHLGGQLQVSRLTANEHNLLVDALSLIAFKDFSANGAGLRNTPACFLYPEQLVVDLQDGNGLQFMRFENHGNAESYTGFGGVVSGLEPKTHNYPKALQDAMDRARQRQQGAP
jgi:hypothetical protein